MTQTRLRPLLVPTEHGGWSFLLEPVVLGLLLAPSLAGAGIATLAVGAFLARHPLKLALSDLRRGQRYERTTPAIAIAWGYGVVALAGLAVAVAARPPIGTWMPLCAVAPLAAIQAVYDARGRGKELVAAVAGVVAAAAIAPAILLANNVSAAVAASVLVLIAFKFVASIAYVRCRLRRDRERPAAPGSAYALHAAGILVAATLVHRGWAPGLAIVPSVLLLARAVHGLSSAKGRVRPQAVGFVEACMGAFSVLVWVAAYRWWR